MTAVRIAPLSASILIALAAAAASAGASAACLPPPSGMVAWWPGDGNTDDIAGTNPGSMQGGGYGAGTVGQAFAFSGSGDYVSVPDSGNPLDGFSGLTLDAWINPSSVSGERGVVTKYDSRYAGTSYFLEVMDGRLRMGAYEDCGINTSFCNVAVTQSDAAVVQAGQWAHVAGTWSGGGQFQLYLDGAPVAASIEFLSNPAPTVISNNATPVNIGRYESSSGGITAPFGQFAGAIDEVEIFDRALSDSEIAAIHAAGSAGKCKTSTLEVAIDIKPGSYPNSINLGASGVIPVAILSTAAFNAPTQVNPDSLTLAGARVRVVGKSAKPLCSAGDVNGDGRADLVCHFENDLEASVGDATAVLEGSTHGGEAIHGEDSIRIVPN